MVSNDCTAFERPREKSTKKWCPMRHGFMASDNGCIEDKCAWWDKNYSACAVHAISRALADIVTIEDKKGR